MKKPGFLLLYLLLTIAQVLLGNFCNFSPYLMVTVLPVMVLCIPVDKGPVFAMIAAFCTGFAVDFLCDGMLGLTSIALVPAALCRSGILRLVFGSEIFSRQENISVRRQGILKMMLGTLLVTAVYLAVYILADGAGTRPAWFDLLKFGISLVASTLVSFFVADLLTTERKWR